MIDAISATRHGVGVSPTAPRWQADRMGSLLDLAERLYQYPPSRFVQARDEAVGAARQRGDRAQARAVAALRRPSAGAWLANLLAAEPVAELAELLEVGEQLRAAQASWDGAALRALTRQRHAVTRVLLARAGELGAAAGNAPSAAAIADLTATLDAAITDPAAAAAATSGRLVRALRTNGLEPVDLSGALALPDLPLDGAAIPAGPAPRPRLRVVRTPAGDAEEPASLVADAVAADAPATGNAPEPVGDAVPGPGRDAVLGQRRARARRVEEARAELAEAERELAAARRALDTAQHGADTAVRRFHAAEAELQDARLARRDSQVLLADAQQRALLAQRARDRAQRGWRANRGRDDSE